MKSRLVLLFLLFTTPLQAWIDPQPHFERRKEAADLITIVRVKSVSPTGKTTRLVKTSKIQFRELVATLELVSALKGAPPKTLKLRLYRFPTEEEYTEDFEDDYERLKAQIVGIDPQLKLPSLISGSASYLAYLKSTEDGHFVPVWGPFNCEQSFIKISSL